MGLSALCAGVDRTGLPLHIGAGAEISAEDVRRSIDRGIKYLTQQQNPNGSWAEFGGFRGGTTALCTLALLNAGLEPSDPQMQRALRYLRKINPDSTYVVALQTMVFSRAEPEKDRMLIARNVEKLENSELVDAGGRGSWSYFSRKPGMNRGGRNIGPGAAWVGLGDNSNSQFALLGLYEAEQVGVKSSDKTWRFARKHWEEGQHPDGSWGYVGSIGPGMDTMTCAGISSLVIAADRMQPPDARVVNGRILCCASREDAEKDDGVERGLDWLGRNFSISRNPRLYYHYGLERAGRLTARRYIGKHDWYREGADYLVRRQDPLSGFWNGDGNDLVSTSFALLFLSKGRWPLLVGKVQHAPGKDWNRHRHDVNNLTRFVESRWKMDLTWQTVDLEAAGVDDLLQSPVLYFCGSASPLPDDPDEQSKLAQQLARLSRPGRLFVRRSVLRRQRLRQGLSRIDLPGFSGKGIPPPTLGFGTSDLAL